MGTGDLYAAGGMKAATATLDALMQERGVSKPIRDAVINISNLMYEYIAYAIDQRKDPTDKKVLQKFLAKKGMLTLKFLGNDSINCALAVVDFILSVQKAATVTSTGVPPAMVLAYGLAILDLIDVGNSCEPAQQAYYEVFLKRHSVTLNTTRVRVRQYYNHDKRMCIMP